MLIQSYYISATRNTAIPYSRFQSLLNDDKIAEIGITTEISRSAARPPDLSYPAGRSARCWAVSPTIAITAVPPVEFPDPAGARLQRRYRAFRRHRSAHPRRCRPVARFRDSGTQSRVARSHRGGAAEDRDAGRAGDHAVKAVGRPRWRRLDPIGNDPVQQGPQA